ncbi:hypothetical protein DSCO28_30220 [Desulfosarcina ovata subsp. sediminis]|uniref:Helix-turn-helix domain-containing protein n=1 Tax=Desulfosarcina ovata subsp. sediminis TaxID=885957 RepID=A0A5K7ZMK7_9BACT|nr:helix-turn-helix domain-containing protein [Desulfosarcina ovata]BBO82456.1 hypothetical protein DSCO28_30220 [Desulfosarcina ovata subsp. sediminis]
MKFQLYRPDQAAKVLNCSKRTIYRLVEGHELEALRVRGVIRIPEAALNDYVTEQIRAFMETEVEILHYLTDAGTIQRKPAGDLRLDQIDDDAFVRALTTCIDGAVICRW